ncbi:MAG TPA: phosphotransferase [Ktedonobacterales bacterium]|nr:phosphotransferase [Ktedonobacterales bacterium]
MSRQGIEDKLLWSRVPSPVRQQVEAIAGAHVARGARVWGGYSPTPTYRLRLADGRGLFFKGVYRDSNPFASTAIMKEARVYRELAHLITPWAPCLHGVITHEDWFALLLEDVGPKSAPPWTPALARAAAQDFAAFHISTLGRDLPEWLPRYNDSNADVSWEAAAQESDDLRLVAELAGERATDAHAWLRASFPRLAEAARAALTIPGPYTLTHNDVRSDNIRITNGRLRLFDWPFAEVGYAEFDLAEFAQSVTVDGGAEPERVVAWYSERLPVRDEALDAAVCWLAAFFANLAWRPELPELPRLRQFQRQQLGVTLRWAARRLRLADPDWTAALG